MKISIADQIKLLELSEAQTTLDGLEARRHSMPERGELSQLIAERAKHKTNAAKSSLNATDLGSEIQRMESDMEKLKRRLDANRRALGAIENTVGRRDAKHDLESTQRRVDALQRKIDNAKSMQKAHGINSEVGFDEFDEKVRHAEKKLADADADLRARIAGVERRMDELRGSLPSDVLKIFDRLREENGIPVARLDGRTCQSCFMELDISTLKSFDAQPVEAVTTCPECNAVIVRPQTLAAGDKA
ncbi:zinc ribbon domain-containing protein [Corynebacterium sp. H113]|uniref:zinc ribbon domain-containing protein n=1 Tax=Corynebacterium sp. H113 TaxID=3133419 RepID=UPI0030A6129F